MQRRFPLQRRLDSLFERARPAQSMLMLGGSSAFGIFPIQLADLIVAAAASRPDERLARQYGIETGSERCTSTPPPRGLAAWPG